MLSVPLLSSNSVRAAVSWRSMLRRLAKQCSFSHVTLTARMRSTCHRTGPRQWQHEARARNKKEFLLGLHKSTCLSLHPLIGITAYDLPAVCGMLQPFYLMGLVENPSLSLTETCSDLRQLAAMDEVPVVRNFVQQFPKATACRQRSPETLLN